MGRQYEVEGGHGGIDRYWIREASTGTTMHRHPLSFEEAMRIAAMGNQGMAGFDTELRKLASRELKSIIDRQTP